MPDVDRCVSEALWAFLQHENAKADLCSKVTLFAESPRSPLACALASAVVHLAQEHLDVRIAFATPDVETVTKFSTKIGVVREGWAALVRTVEPSQYAACNEQLVLGSWGYVSGPTVAQAKRGRGLDIAEVSESRQELAVATFAFELLWRTSSRILEPSRPARGKSSLAALLSALSAGSLARVATRA